MFRLAADAELPRKECEPFAEFEQEMLEFVDKCALNLFLACGKRFGDIQKLQHIRIFYKIRCL